MTEQEAKTKWCPYTRMVTADNQDAQGTPILRQPQTTFNRIAVNRQTAPVILDQSNCIGSACMAWRVMETGNWTRTFREWMDAEQWIEAIKVYRNYTGSTLKDAKDFVDAVRTGQKPMPTPEPSGYCGLAGKP